MGYFAGIRGDRVDMMAHKLDTSNTKYALSGFGRAEKYLGDYTLYAGLGYAQRIPDFWEVSKGNGLNLKKEKTRNWIWGQLITKRILALACLAMFLVFKII